MDSSQVVTVLSAVILAVGASIVTGLFARPTTKASAGATEAGGQVAISADAREWASKFEATAERAEQRAKAAEARAEAAEEHADAIEQASRAVERRCADLEERFDIAIRYIKGLRDDLVTAGGHPAPIPPALIPPLSRDD